MISTPQPIAIGQNVFVPIRANTADEKVTYRNLNYVPEFTVHETGKVSFNETVQDSKRNDKDMQWHVGLDVLKGLEKKLDTSA